MLLRLGFAVSANAINPLSPPLRSPQQRPQGHPAKSKFLAVKVVSPDDVLHGELRRDPRPAVNPADTTSEAELKAEPLTFFHRVVDLGIPLRRAKDIIPVCFRRTALGQIYHVGSLVAQLFHGLEVLGDAVNRDIIIEPVPPGARAILRGGVGKSLLEAVRTCVLRRITVACSEHAECG